MTPATPGYWRRRLALTYRINLKEIYHQHINKLVRKLQKTATSLITLRQDDEVLLSLSGDEPPKSSSEKGK